MSRPGSEFGGRFRVLRNFTTDANSIALAEDTKTGRNAWLTLLSVTAGANDIAAALDAESRFALGVPGLARPIASGIDGELAFIAFASPESVSVAEAHRAAWSAPRVAALARRIALALGPLHDQGIAYGCLRPELVVESEQSDVLFGFGVAALATRFGAAGEASQLLPPNYRAPELRNALVPPTPSSDVYAFGALLRELLSAPEAAEIGSAAPASGLSPALDALLSRALAPEPRARPGDVRAFAAELERIAISEAEVIPAPSASASEFALPSVVAEPPLPAEPSAPSAPPWVDPVPPPALALPPAAAPRAFAPPVQPRPASSVGTVIALSIAFAGLLMMVGSVAGVIAFAARVHPMKPSLSTRPHHLPPGIVGPPVLPAPSDDEAPPVPLAPAEPKKKPMPAALSHAPLLPPGVGPSVFPEEAHAALPITGTEPIWGTRHAPLTWLLFGDLECPHTRHIWRALEASKVTFGDDLRIVFRHRPLPEHPYALEAARVLAGLAKQRGPAAFFSVLHRISQDDAPLTDERLLADMDAAGYSGQRIAELSSEGESAVAGDLELAGQFGVRATPLSFANGTRIEGERNPDEIQRLLLDERRSATWVLATGASAKELYSTRTSSNLIGLGVEEASRVCVPVSGSPMRGPADALVTLVQFSDFECPYCKQVEPTLKTLLARYPRTLRLVWKDYPLPQHKRARLLANFAADAGARGSNTGFWAVHDGLFAKVGELDDGVLGDLAGKAGLDGALLLIAAHSGVHDAAIHADTVLGERLGVSGTPTFFANGRRIQGALSLDQFDALIRAELGSAERIVAHGVARDKIYRLVCDADD